MPSPVRAARRASDPADTTVDWAAASDEAGPMAPAPAARSYYGAQAAAAEQRNIFRHSWLVAGLAAELTEPGSFLTTEVAGMPVLLTRDMAGAVHALANVCQHRGMILASGRGTVSTLTCPNHAWVYGLEGDLVGAPRTSHETGFSCAEIRLPRFAVHIWGPLVLVNLDATAEPPTHPIALIDDDLIGQGIDFAAMRLAADVVDWSMSANWKIVIENYLECYHCAMVHPEFAKVFDVSQQRYALRPRGALLSATAPVRQSRDSEPRDSILSAATGEVSASFWHLLFPTTTVNVYPGQGAVEITWYWPEGSETTRGRTAVFVGTDADTEYVEQVIRLSTLVGEQDATICESMHRGMRSGALARPRILPVNERLLMHFHGLLAVAAAERRQHA